MATTQTAPIVNLNMLEQKQPRSKSLFQKAVYRLTRDPLTLVALTVIVLMTLMSVFAPVICDLLNIDPFHQTLSNIYADMGAEGHPFGTDDLGRDHLARLLYGAQVSLGIGFGAAGLSVVIGISLGVITGYYGGIVDDIVIWFITTLNSIPSLFLLLIISAVLSPSPSTLVLVLAFLGWTGTTRLVRGETFSLREREFTVAARAIGASDFRIMYLHILPNVISLIVITLAQAIGGLILIESGLSYLGFGIKPPTPSWGNMLTSSQELIRQAPHLAIAPGLLIAITVLCLYIVGDGLRDAFDPKLAD